MLGYIFLKSTQADHLYFRMSNKKKKTSHHSFRSALPGSGNSNNFASLKCVLCVKHITCTLPLPWPVSTFLKAHVTACTHMPAMVMMSARLLHLHKGQRTHAFLAFLLPPPVLPPTKTGVNLCPRHNIKQWSFSPRKVVVSPRCLS